MHAADILVTFQDYLPVCFCIVPYFSVVAHYMIGLHYQLSYSAAYCV